MKTSNDDCDAKQIEAFLTGELREGDEALFAEHLNCLLYTSPSPRDRQKSRMPSSA